MQAVPRPRLGETCGHPNGIPYRNHPEAVIKQVKTVCAAYPSGSKMRTVTDGGAIRKRRRKVNSLITRLDVARDVARAQTGETADAARRVLRDALGSATELSRGQFVDKMSTKGKPGDDSVNACLPDDRSRCKYAAFSQFLIMIDLLVSSVGLPSRHDPRRFLGLLRDVRPRRVRQMVLRDDRERWRVHPRITVRIRHI